MRTLQEALDERRAELERRAADRAETARRELEAKTSRERHVIDLFDRVIAETYAIPPGAIPWLASECHDAFNSIEYTIWALFGDWTVQHGAFITWVPGDSEQIDENLIVPETEWSVYWTESAGESARGFKNLLDAILYATDPECRR